jgi:hypothetical protein
LRVTNLFRPILLAKSALLDELKVEGNADAVDEDEALVEELLVRDFGVDELLEGGGEMNSMASEAPLEPVARLFPYRVYGCSWTQ